MKLFIAGTDTNVGKTYISAGILSAFTKMGFSTLGIKPIASGCKRIQEKLINDDTLIHQQYSSIKLDSSAITPFMFEPAIAPHIAAAAINRELSVDEINTKLRPAMEHPVHVIVTEGCGGWYTPLNTLETMADFALSSNYKFILVVGIRLGCINHALLTYCAMQEDGANVIGWIANCIDPDMKNCEENIATLKEWLPAPCLCVVEYGASVDNMIDAKKIIGL